ncbi:hypothetical protein CVT26_011660 [Gymnopilus dilepis]|uniref:RING-CH-type domain-containing protein n=1 Tax=Gymnopilus dilepis TaxID=231916 RepID=A0A409WCB5_9AGAR|nr:hypothetical protein CVT26_011660 [Gymnopilus dilepis]
MAATPTARVPTVNDLRVKLCYICREEESAEDPQQGPARAWTHPCNCTLIAHEQCLLKWIQASQGNAARAPNALKCPQCGTEYEMTSDEPVLLRVMTVSNRILQKLGRYFSVFAAAGVFAVVGTSIYICLTGYGAWALQNFIGKELYDQLLTDDPVNWPWSAWINLPLIPISLILSRFQPTPSVHSLLVPLLIVWPPSPPVGAHAKRIYEYWLSPENANKLPKMRFQRPALWPPPPVAFGLFVVPFIKAFYRIAYRRVYKRVLGTAMPLRTRNGVPPGGLRFNEGPFVIRIRANVEEDNNAPQQGQGRRGGNGQALQPPPPPLIDLDDEPQNNPQNAANAADQPQDPNAEVVEAAEQLIEINASSLGRRVAGALLIPAISNLMGSLLYRLSKHSRFLRAFLGIRRYGSSKGGGVGLGAPPSFWSLNPWGRYGLKREWEEMSPMQVFLNSTKMILATWFGGSTTWMGADPVWWRNCVGFGLFVAAKDALQLLHLWLAKKELESRKVKDKDFAGVDIRELDLLPEFFAGREGLRRVATI